MIASHPHIRRPARRGRGAALLACLAATQLACATGTERLVSSGVQGGLTGTLEALNDPHNKVLLKRLLQDADIQAAAHDLTEAITGGALDGITDDVRMQRARAASDAYIRTIADAVGKALDEDISPAVTRGVGDVVGGTVAAALQPENRRLAGAFVDNVTRSTITAFMQSTSKGLRDDLGPALNKVLQQDLGPGLQRVIEDNLGPAMRTVVERDLQPMVEAALGGEDGGGAGLFARALTKQIVLGVNDGMSDLGISLSPGNKRGGLGLLGWLLIGLGVVLLLMTVVLVRLFLTRRAMAADRARSEEMLVNILRAIKTGDEDDDPTTPDFNSVIARARLSMPDLDGHEAYLATVINRAQLPSRPGAQRQTLPRGKNPYAAAKAEQPGPKARPPEA